MKNFLLTVSCLLLFILSASAQNLKIQGTVTEEGGSPIPGANVVQKGTTNGTITDLDGNFTLEVNSPEAILQLSFIGMKTEEVKASSIQEAPVVLKSDVFGLEEVVAIGYGTTKKKDLTGSVSSVRLEDSPIAIVPNINPMQALQGTTPGLNIGQVTSAGASPSLLIRGQNSLNASNNPLVVVDGVIFHGSINELSTNDIASIDILKDASAAAIYGSRSANGVIIITTKKGKSSKPTINLNVYTGIQNWTTKPDMRTGDDFIQWRRDNKKIRGAEDLDLEDILWPLELKAYQEGHQINWMDEISQTGVLQNYEASISGKTEKTNYYVSGTYVDQQGVVANDIYEKYAITSKIENTITDWLSFGLNFYYAARDYSGKSPGLYEATYMSPFSYKYVDGYENQLQRFPSGSTSLLNPYWGNPGSGDIRLADDMNKNYSLRTTGFVDIKVPYIKGLNYRVNVSENRLTTKTANFAHENAYINTLIEDDILNPSKFLNKANGWKKIETTRNWLIDNILTYNFHVKDHKVDMLLGYTREQYIRENVRYAASDFEATGTTVLGWNGLSLGNSEKRSGSTDYRQESNVGYIGRLNYSFRNKYLLTLNFRRDGFSGFAPGHKFGNFPGASIAWTVSEENFIKDNFPMLDYVKLRASYGKNGNQGIAPYATMASVSTGTTIFGDSPFIYSYPSALANKALTWETTSAFNFGLNFSIFDGKLSGSLDAYKSQTTDQLLTRYLPIMTGYGSITTNLAQVDNTGIEFSLKSTNIDQDHFKWETGYSFWRNRSELVSLYGLDSDGDGVEDDDIGNGWFIGEELGAIYDYTVEGIVQTEDTEYINQFGFAPGDLKIRDINGRDDEGNLTGQPDGVINSADRSIIGYRTPAFNMNLSNTLTFRNFQLYFDINFIAGGKNRYLGNNKYGLNPGQIMPEVGNWLNDEYWMPDNQSTKNPRPNYGNPFGYGFYQSREFVRLQNLTLSYTCPEEITNLLNVSTLKIFASGKNLFTLTDWTGLDPETGGTIGTSNPALRIITLGANLSF
ncbi:SusC/RagA family TonB-linked outer membrane protein [Sunxiuqinia rutila]|uniref:SusC/RagA family TonB-linked outer membrane protein n=1 Tax=Sunxiuqinia rutila TaxID=1397841 RepID=UPI003D3646E8